MKELYEKPAVESEKFAFEMLKAGDCSCLPADLERKAAFVSFPAFNCACGDCTGSYNSAS
jgi:hypothetical protein